MAYRENRVKCSTCGQYYICGDCITYECYECEQKRLKNPPICYEIRTKVLEQILTNFMNAWVQPQQRSLYQVRIDMDKAYNSAAEYFGIDKIRELNQESEE